MELGKSRILEVCLSGCNTASIREYSSASVLGRRTTTKQSIPQKEKEPLNNKALSNSKNKQIDVRRPPDLHGLASPRV